MQQRRRRRTGGRRGSRATSANAVSICLYRCAAYMIGARLPYFHRVLRVLCSLDKLLSPLHHYNLAADKKKDQSLGNLYRRQLFSPVCST